MNNQYVKYIGTVVSTLMLAGSVAMSNCHAEEAGDYADFFSAYPDQSEFPQIILQPVNQLVHAGDDASFAVYATNGPLTYQWLKNGAPISNETNNTLTILKTSVSDVGLYSCQVLKGLEMVPTRAAQLMVYVNRTDLDSGVDPVVVWATAVITSGTKGACPGTYAGYVSYSKTVAQGWGWAPATNTTVHTATDTNRVTTKVEYYGKNLDSGCAQTTVTVPDPTFSTKYRFTIYFTNNVPTNAYSITLDGFNP